jgi:DNA-binding MarR family transcriptional regulator
VSYPLERLDDDVHQRVRLGILALLSNVTRADFTRLKEALATTDGNLGRHLRVLEEAKLVEITKVIEGRRPRTWVKITKEGRSALHSEIEALKEIVSMVEGEPEPAEQTRRSLAIDPGAA